jgi:hypothetical protein
MTSMRSYPKPLPKPTFCRVCAGIASTHAELKAHNLACADYGERVYRGPNR